MPASGDRDLTDRRAPAVVAYCRERCPPGAVTAAATAALTAFGAAPSDTDEQLLDATRVAAGAHCAAPDLPAEWEDVLDSLREARATRAFRAAIDQPQMSAELVDASLVGEVGAPPSPERTPPEPAPLESAGLPDESAPEPPTSAEQTTPAPGLAVFAPSERAAAPTAGLGEPLMVRRRTRRPSVLRRYSVFLVTVALGAVVVVVVALVLGSTSSGSSASSLPPPSPASTPPARVGTSAPHLVVRRHRAHAAHRLRRSTAGSAGSTTSSS